jgi:pimeloyl-ACP methyl ester carboxylesterase
MAGSKSSVMPPKKARGFAGAIPDGSLELVGGASHHVELEAPSVVAARIIELTQASPGASREIGPGVRAPSLRPGT